jgi:hypothetical protein
VVRKFGEELQLRLLQLAFWFWLGLFSWLWFGLFVWPLVIVAWCANLGERCTTLVGYCSASGITLSVKVKVLKGGLCAYGWVTKLLYCLWKNEHISLFLTGYGVLVSIGSIIIARHATS